MAASEKRKVLQTLISLCLIANLIILVVVIYGTFYQNQEQEMAISKLQANVTKMVAGGSDVSYVTKGDAEVGGDYPEGGDAYIVSPGDGTVTQPLPVAMVSPGDGTVTQPLPVAVVKPNFGEDGVMLNVTKGITVKGSSWPVCSVEAIKILEEKIAQCEKELGEY